MKEGDLVIDEACGCILKITTLYPHIGTFDGLVIRRGNSPLCIEYDLGDFVHLNRLVHYRLLSELGKAIYGD